MTPKKNYAQLIDSIFGVGTANFNVAKLDSNNVIGALNHPTEYNEFKENFKQRLRRLAKSIQKDNSLRTEILKAINTIATSEWDGAYAELCALDYFLSSELTGPGNVILDRTVSADQTLASEMKKQNANHDLHFPNLKVSMDTKLLSDKIAGILNGIFEDFKQTKGIRHLTILPSYNLADDFSVYQHKRNRLLAEIIQNVDIQARPKKFESQIIEGLSYQFGWEPSVLVAEQEYSPLEHAQNHHHVLFTYAKKFSRVEPTVIVIVHFPWSGEKLYDFCNAKQIFFKNLGTHFFYDYIDSSEPARNLNREIKTLISVSELTKYLSGIIFLDDDLIMSPKSNEINVKANFYWNPNAIHSLVGSQLESCLQQRGAYNLANN